MRLAKTALIIVGLIDLVLAAGFFFQQPWATAFWPLPDTPLSYAFIAAILAGGAAPLIWIGLSGELAALAGYGLSFGIMYAVLNPKWTHAQGPLLGFLVYDLVLFSPLFARFGNLQPEHVRGQVAASLIIIFSAALGVYYLFVNPATRLRARTEM